MHNPFFTYLFHLFEKHYLFKGAHFGDPTSPKHFSKHPLLFFHLEIVLCFGTHLNERVLGINNLKLNFHVLRMSDKQWITCGATTPEISALTCRLRGLALTHSPSNCAVRPGVWQLAGKTNHMPNGGLLSSLPVSLWISTLPAAPLKK